MEHSNDAQAPSASVEATTSLVSDSVASETIHPEPSEAASAEEVGDATPLAQDFEDLSIVEEPPLTAEEIATKVKEANECKRKGNELYLTNDFEAAEAQYTAALDVCPITEDVRSIYYNNRAACYLKMEQYEACVDDCSKAIEINEAYIKAYARRAMAHEKLEQFEKSLEDFNKVLELDPSHVEARKASVRLPPLVEQEREKMKQEMFGKLRELGDMCLKPFGLSTNNFQMQQDPNTGSYSLNFVQNGGAGSAAPSQN
eukprot:TRINITY_DN5226_c0_g1_i1.p1 TRINITY_DN5226_c0_g1~~TRINITY_DN5226_c0_g1_i1.p1  ORF type:complete len:258 (+),score=66.32 TRINITY_DN5226_c0_g1_i1:75-848(+)